MKETSELYNLTEDELKQLKDLEQYGCHKFPYCINCPISDNLACYFFDYFKGLEENAKITYNDNNVILEREI